jgi:ketosteroid isomerase-like protein
MKTKLQFAMLLAVSAILFSSCATPAGEAKPIDMEKAKLEIQAKEDAFAAAEKAKDANAVAAYYADDAISYSRNMEPAAGMAAIKDQISKNLAKDTTGNHSVYKVVDLFGEGNMLVEVGSWSVQDPGGAEVNKGHYMSYFQKRDGKYVCVRDMNVTSMPEKK